LGRNRPEWLAPASLEEALALRASFGDEATVVAGGTFIGILMNQNILKPQTLLSLHAIPDLAFIRASGGNRETSYLRIGAMTTHRTVESSALVHRMCPILASTFSLVAGPRVRNQATVGGVLADADCASDPPAALAALDARAVLRSPRGEREVAIEELILGFYETCIESDELLTEVRVPAGLDAATYRKFRSRSAEDRPCVAVAAARAGGVLRVVVGACAEVPQLYPDICAEVDGRPLDATLAREIGERYAERLG